MKHLRFSVRGRILKPIPQELSDRLPAIRDAVSDLKSYARKINEGKPNEEMTVMADIDNQEKWVDFSLELAIPEDSNGTEVLGLKVDPVLASRLPTIIQHLRKLKTFLTAKEGGSLGATYHICYHADEFPQSCVMKGI